MTDDAKVTASFIEDSVKKAAEHSASISIPSKSTHRDLVTGTEDDSHFLMGSGPYIAQYLLSLYL